MNLNMLKDQPRLLLEVDLRPAQGERFQPTGFPDLGAATFTSPNGTHMLLVESAQSMANRLENVCWDEGNGCPATPLKELPYVEAVLSDGSTTNSMLEAHRLNSPYIVNSPEFDAIKADVGFAKDKPFDRRRLAKALLKYDPSSLVHGIFLEKIGGVVRLPRALSGFIEARNVRIAASGGAKVDRIQPGTTGTSTPYGKAEEGYGNVIYQRDEYTGDITAYFSLDLSLLRGYGLGEKAEDLLITLSLYKIGRLLRDGLRLRTACDLEPSSPLRVKRPEGFQMPTLEDLERSLPTLISEVNTHTGGKKTVVRYAKKAEKVEA